MLVILIAFLVTLTMGELEKPERNNQKLEAVHNSSLLPEKQKFTSSVILLIGMMSVVRFLQIAGVGTAIIYFNVYMDTELAVSPGKIGIIAGIGRLMSVPIVLFAPLLIRRKGTGTVAVWASLATVICLLPLALIPHWWAAAIAYASAIALTSLRFTAFIVYIMMLVPNHQQSVMAGAGEMASGFSFAVMALVGGYILALFSFRDLFLLGASLSLLGTLIFWFHLRSVKIR
jgi:predicted MFS family arabinose efflux permease